jgi:hypothetical protein
MSAITTSKQFTQEQITQMSGDANAGVSICIPRVFPNIGWHRIKQIFIALNWGYVERVDVIPSKGTKRAFVHFAPGKFTQKRVLQALCEGKKIKIEYDTPWYWMISLSRSAKPDEAPSAPKFKVEIDPKVTGVAKKQRANPARRKVTLDLSDPVEARLASTVPNEDGEIVENTD